jgi:hypothetical protein
VNHDELIERLTEAEVREPRRPSGAYTTTLGAQAAAALRELQAELDEAEKDRLTIANVAADRIKHLENACQSALQALDTYNSMYRHHMTVQLISARANLRDVLANVDNEGV